METFKKRLVRTCVRPISYKLRKYDKEVSKTDKTITFTRYSELSYEQVVEGMVATKYTIKQELAILRQQNTKPSEYQEYYDYVEQCKVVAKEFIEERTLKFGSFSEV